MTLKRIIGYFDWRLWICVAAAGSVFFLGYGVVTSHQEAVTAHRESVAKDRRIDALVHQLEREHHEQATERRILLAGQSALNAKYERLLDYLNSIGVFIPAEVVGNLPTHHSDGQRRSSSHSGGTANSGPDNPSKAGGSGKASGGSTGGGGNSGGGKSHGKSGSKSHGKNKGGKSSSHKPHKAKKK